MTAQFELIKAATLRREDLHTLLSLDECYFTGRDMVMHQAMRELRDMGTEPDMPSLVQYLKDVGKYDFCGGDSLIEEFVAPVVMRTDYLVKSIKSEHVRNIYRLLAKDVYQAVEKKKSLEEIAALIQTATENIVVDDGDGETVGDLAGRNLDDVFLQSDCVTTGLRTVDDIIGGFYGGQMITLGARPGLGKSALALNIAMHVDNVLFFSLEMKRREIYARALSVLSDVEAIRIEDGRCNLVEIQRIGEAREKLQKTKIKVYDSTHDINKILTTIHRHCTGEPPRLIIVDYLQLIKGGEGEKQVYRIGYISRALKLIAMKYDVPVLVLSQLSRESEKDSRRPRLSDLRDSGSIEQDSDVVLFLYEDSGVHDFIIAKNRKGKSGKTCLNLEKKFMRFKCFENNVSRSVL